MNSAKSKTMCRNCRFRSDAVALLNDPELRVLEKNCSEAIFRSGETVFKENALTSHIVYIKAGLIKVHMRGPKDKDQILKIAQPESYLGISTVFGDRINHYSASAIEDSVICYISSTVFKTFMLDNGRFSYEILMQLCKDELAYFERFVKQTQKQLHGRLADALLYFSDTIYQSDEFELSLSRNDLSDLIGASRESVSRVLSKFKEDGIIEIKAKRIKLCDKQLIQKISKTG